MEGAGRGGRREERGKGGSTEEEIEKLLSGLRLTEGERSGVRLGRKTKSVSEVEEELCLVGRLLTKKHFNVEALAKTLAMVWRPSRGLDHKLLEGNLILFKFYDLGDLRRVLRDGPWSFDGHALLLKEFEGDKRQTDISFDRLPIWVRIYNLPLGYMTKVDGETLGANFGEVLEVEVDKGGKAWGRYMRIRVELKVADSLPRGVMLYLGDEAAEGAWCRAAYEKLPNFCYHCGKLDHVDKECQEPLEQDLKPQYGAWLRASPSKKKSWGGGKKEGPNYTPGRSDGGRRWVANNLLERFGREEAGGDERREESDLGVNSEQQRASEAAGKTSEGRPVGSLERSREFRAMTSGGVTGATSGLVTKERVGEGDRNREVSRRLEQPSSSEAQLSSSREVISPQKKGELRMGSCPITLTRERKVKRRYNVIRREEGKQALVPKEASFKPPEGELGGIGKRKLEEEESVVGDNLVSRRRKRGKKGGPQLLGGKESDDDMLLVDLVGAEVQPHQEQ